MTATATVFSLELARILVFILQVALGNAQDCTVHVVQAGIYQGTWSVHREGLHYQVEPGLPDSELPAFEAERSPKYAHILTLVVPETGESATVNLAEALKAWQPAVREPQTIAAAEGAEWKVYRLGSLFVVAEESSQSVLLMELAARPAR